MSLFWQFPKTYNFKHTREDAQWKAQTEALATQLAATCLVQFPNKTSVRSIWFIDEKTFNAATPVNSQNGGAYLHVVETKKRQVSKRRLLRRHEHLNCGVIWYQLVCLEWRKLVFCSLNHAGAKVNSEYYCEHVLRRGFLSVNPVNQGACGRYNWTL